VARGNPNPSPVTRFVPGQSGNPGGRPAGESFASILREALEADHKKAPSWRHALVVKAVAMAASGDLDALKWIADRTDGKVKDQLEQSGEVRHVIHVTYVDETVTHP
jgi:hypothetical protein